MDNWVTVARYTTLTDADMSRSRLQAAGIEVWIEGEHSASTLVLGMAYSQVKVPAEQAEEARRILESLDVEDEEAETETSSEDSPIQDSAWVEVAQCSSLCEADIICSRLRADGIDARVEDECSMVMGYWLIGQMTALPIIIVPTDQATDALEILNALEDSNDLDNCIESDDLR